MNAQKHMGSYRAYLIGFGLSLVFTLTAYAFTWQHVESHHSAFPHQLLIPIIVILALAQLITQLVFFLHLGRESKPRWNLMVFLFAVMIVGIVVFGSLWIMQSLNYRMHPKSTETYIIKDEGYSEKHNDH
jgi:cytochrome o ubiquinol oxidase subunit IV